MTTDPKTMTTFRDVMTEAKKYSLIETILEYLKMYRFFIKTISVTVSKQNSKVAVNPYISTISIYLSVNGKKSYIGS